MRLPGELKIGHPQIDHLEQVVAVAHVGMAEHQRLFEIQPRERVQRVGIRRRDAAVIGRRIALDVDERIHRPARAFDRGHIAHLHPRDFGGDERVAVDIGIDGDLAGFVGGERLSLGSAKRE